MRSKRISVLFIGLIIVMFSLVTAVQAQPDPATSYENSWYMDYLTDVKPAGYVIYRDGAPVITPNPEGDQFIIYDGWTSAP